MLDFLKGLCMFILAMFMVIVVIVSIIFLIVLGDQYLNYVYWKDYKYKIEQDSKYWYTNKYELKNNSIKFISNYGHDVEFFEKYKLSDNLWHKQKPTLKTVWFGY
jgi:hypothetical protein